MEYGYYPHDYERLTGAVFGGKYLSGIRKAAHLKIFNGGWYAFLTKKAAKKYNPGKIKVCYAKPQWIKRLGRYPYIGKAGIFTHLAFPNWDKGTMTVREFKKMCKEHKEK